MSWHFVQLRACSDDLWNDATFTRYSQNMYCITYTVLVVIPMPDAFTDSDTFTAVNTLGQQGIHIKKPNHATAQVQTKINSDRLGACTRERERDKAEAPSVTCRCTFFKLREEAHSTNSILARPIMEIERDLLG